MAETWAVVLAGGEGTRLRKITTNRQGIVIPKQYCSLGRSSCLLQDAVIRAATVVMPSHVCAVVAAQHRRWWSAAMPDINESNVFVQPQNKGTAFGILLALLTLERRSPDATLIVLPADHYFRDEEMVTRALRVASNLASAHPSTTYLIGAEPDSPDPELGYIVPAERAVDKPAPVSGFAEKPDGDYARELISRGALWNLFILVGSAASLLKLFAQEHADAVAAMREGLRREAAGDLGALNAFYEGIAPVDFSHEILEVQANRLQVMRVQHCGWTDLGTPKRVEATVRSMALREGVSRDSSAGPAALFYDLGSQFS